MKYNIFNNILIICLFSCLYFQNLIIFNYNFYSLQLNTVQHQPKLATVSELHKCYVQDANHFCMVFNQSLTRDCATILTVHLLCVCVSHVRSSSHWSATANTIYLEIMAAVAESPAKEIREINYKCCLFMFLILRLVGIPFSYYLSL